MTRLAGRPHRATGRSGPSSSPTAARSPRGSPERATDSGSARSSRRPTVPDALDLLDIDAVVAAARAAGADAVHPGFGFLAENADFAEAVIAAGIRWVGPPPAAIRAMGDKAAARRLAASLGVPVLPGYDDAGPVGRRAGRGRASGSASRSWSSRRPAAAARGCGPSASRTALAEALAAARREAAAAFGDDRLILERLVVGRAPRRDPGPVRCARRRASTSASATARSSAATRRSSRRRRRRRSIAALRARLGERGADARRRGRLRRAPGPASSCSTTRGAADLPRDEHAAPGRAPGHGAGHRPRPRRRPARDRRGRAARADRGRTRPSPTSGHAVEVRLYAEDAEDGFLPGDRAGRGPPLADRRRASGSMPGSSSATEIGGRFDPMLAKIIAWGPDRAAALERLAGALDETVVLGRRHEPAVPALARPPAGRPRRRRADRRPDRIWPPDDWAAAHGDPRRRLGDRRGRPARDGRRSAPTRGPAAGGSTRPRSVRLEADGVDARRRRRDAPRPRRADALESRRPRRRHRPSRPRRPERRLPPRAAARRRRCGPRGRRARRRRARPDRSTSSRRCRAPSSPSTPRSARPSRPATRSSPSRR